MNHTTRLITKTIIACAVILVAPAAASAATLFTVAEQHGGKVPNPGRFEAIIGYPNQCVRGIPCWTYTKGTRSGVSTWPESWYLHQGGQRIRDKVFHLYVMDPRSPGWQQHVAHACGQNCFLDGMGTSSITRTTPHLNWTQTQWLNSAALVVRAVVHAGKQALPNSVGVGTGVLISAASGRGSTEAYNTRNAQTLLGMGAIWVAERGGCLDKYHAFLAYKQAGDHFSCYEQGHLPWDTSWLTGG